MFVRNFGRVGVGSQCPNCGKDDQAIKVSAIVSGGTMINPGRGSSFGISPSLSIEGLSISGSFTSGQATGMSQTGLAEKLKLVQEHEAGWPAAIPLVALLVGGSFAMGAIIGLGERKGYPVLGGRNVLMLGVIGVLVLIAAAFYAREMLGKKHAILANERRREMWDTLYYCYRDDAVYVPGVEWSLPAGYLHETLWNGSWLTEQATE